MNDEETSLDKLRPLYEAAERRAEEEKRKREAAEQRTQEGRLAITEQDAATSAAPVMTTYLQSHTPIKNATPIQNAQKFSMSTSATARPSIAQAIEREIYQNIHTIWHDLDLYEVFFQRHTQHLQAAKQIFTAFSSVQHPFHDGKMWLDWPTQHSEKNVVLWLQAMVNRIATYCKSHPSMPTITRHMVGTSLSLGSTSMTDCKPDCIIVDATVSHVSNWGQVASVIELKDSGNKNPTSTWLQLARYAWELFKNQCNRRFVLALSIHGSDMLIWSLDRSGMLGSSKININTEGEKFLSVLLGFLTMGPALIGFDPTIMILDDSKRTMDAEFDPTILTLDDSKRAMDVTIDGEQQRVILDYEITHYRGIVTRGTICWRAHLEDAESTPLVVKDSWQPPEHQEGELLQRVKSANIANIPRLLHAYAVQVNGRVDDVFMSIRNGIDATCGNSYRVRYEDNSVNQDTSTNTTASVDKKRHADDISEAGQPLTKRQRWVPENRIHQRVILGDIGTRIEEEDPLDVLLICIAQCIQAHKQLLDSHVLHRDISPGKILVNQDRSDPSRLGLLIDFDHAVDTNRSGPSASGIAKRAGTIPFMSINILYGTNNFKHSFMDDLESFFWVLYWVCLHRDSTLSTFLAESTYNPAGLAIVKRDIVVASSFERELRANCASQYKALIPCLVELWRLIFPNGREWEEEHMDHGLYEKMKDILKKHSELVAGMKESSQGEGEQEDRGRGGRGEEEEAEEEGEE